MLISGNSFIVTGGSSGLGAATASALVAAGAQVVVADIDRNAGMALVDGLGPRSRFVQVDVASESDAQAAVDLAQKSFGGLHGLINCAGIAPAEKVVGREGPLSLAVFSRTIQINLVGTFNMLRAAATAMAGNSPGATGERGVIINTASIAAFDGQIGQAAYAASKGGVVSMTLPIARELARTGIRVMAIAPGIFETPMVLKMPQEVRESLGKLVPFPPRMGKPAEFASLAMHIIENVMLNGEVIRLDGAVRMSAK